MYGYSIAMHRHIYKIKSEPIVQPAQRHIAAATNQAHNKQQSSGYSQLITNHLRSNDREPQAEREAPVHQASLPAHPNSRADNADPTYI